MALPIAAILGLAQFIGPKIVNMVAGEKAGKVAQAVADTAMSITGKDNPDDALAVIEADPKLALEYKEAVMAQENDLEQMYLADRQDARNRDIAIRKEGYSNVRADILAFAAIGGLVAMIWILLFREIPAGPGRDMLLMLSGALVAVVKEVYSFEFGSSRGSKEKDIH